MHIKCSINFLNQLTMPNAKLKASALFATPSFYSIVFPMQNKWKLRNPLMIQPRARANTRQESPKIRNRRFRKKFNGTSVKPRLSVFCSDKQLYAMLVDDENKKCLFYGSTLKKSIRGHHPCTTIEAAQRVGEELVKACIDLKIHEISWYDRNGFARGEKMEAFEIAIANFGFLLG